MQKERDRESLTKARNKQILYKNIKLKHIRKNKMKKEEEGCFTFLKFFITNRNEYVFSNWNTFYAFEM